MWLSPQPIRNKAGNMHTDGFPHERHVQANPENPALPEILAKQVALEVLHLGFDGKVHAGVIEVHKDAAEDIRMFFEQALAIGFPIEKVVPAGDPEYGWDDDKLMADNATSGFNYRTIAGTDRPSPHGTGWAFDVNDRLNPYIRYQESGQTVSPSGAVWDPSVPGTLYAEHPLVRLMEERGWEWGGNWTPESGRVDYQHFQKRH